MLRQIPVDNRTETGRNGYNDSYFYCVCREEGQYTLCDSFRERDLECLAEKEDSGNIDARETGKGSTDDNRYGPVCASGFDPVHGFSGYERSNEVACKITAGGAGQDGQTALSAGEYRKTENTGKKEKTNRSGTLYGAEKNAGKNCQGILNDDVDGTDRN